MKIAFVTQWYDPEVGSAAIPGAIVRALQARGHDVEVITGFPNYPHGRLYEGYRIRPYARETIRGVTVHRLPLYPSHDRSAGRRILNFVSFMLSVSTAGAVLARRSEVTLVYSTPATVGAAGWVLRRLLGRPFVLYIQDVWPDTLTATGMLPRRLDGPAESILTWFCNAIYRSANKIAVIAPGMKELLVGRGVAADKVDVVFNWVDESIFRPEPRQAPPHGEFHVMYAGNLGDVQGLDVAIRAIAKLGADSPVRLRLVGSGVAEASLRKLAADLAVEDRVWFEGPRDITEMSAAMASAQVQLICLRDDPLFHLTIPSKVQAILAAGQPLISCAPGDAGRLAAEANAGWSVTPGDIEELAEAMRKAALVSAAKIEELGRNARAFYDERLCAEKGAAALESALAASLEAAQ